MLFHLFILNRLWCQKEKLPCTVLVYELCMLSGFCSRRQKIATLSWDGDDSMSQNGDWLSNESPTRWYIMVITALQETLVLFHGFFGLHWLQGLGFSLMVRFCLQPSPLMGLSCPHPILPPTQAPHTVWTCPVQGYLTCAGPKTSRIMPLKVFILFS